MHRVATVMLLVTAQLWVTWPSWAADPVVELPFCSQMKLLREQHPDKYVKRYYDWKLPPTTYYKSSNYYTFLSESSSAVRMDFPGGSSIERVRKISCSYQPSMRYLSQPAGYRDTSYAHVLLPRGVSYWPPSRVLRVSGYATHDTPRTISAQIDIGRLDYPPSVVDVYATHAVVVEIRTQKQGSSSWSSIGGHTYYMWRSDRVTRTVYARLGAGTHRVELVVSVITFSPKPISLKLHAARLRGVEGEDLIRRQLGALSWRGAQQIQQINLRKLLHEQYLQNTDGVLCSAVDTVDKILEATELVVFGQFADYTEWRDSLEGGATYWLADEVLAEAQRQGGIPDGVDPWDYLTEQRAAVDLACSGQTIVAPSEEAFANKSGAVREAGISNARAYQVAIAELGELQEEAVVLVELIGASRSDYAWTELEF